MPTNEPVLPPGTLLQLMYLKERLKAMPPGRFIEIGPGSGEITKLLLGMGWSGVSYDLDANTVQALKERFSSEIAAGRYAPINEDFLTAKQDKADLVISCMVMEHLEDDLQQQFLHKSQQALTLQGCMIGIVPGSPQDWGIEDDIAGHCRRYTRDDISTLANKHGWRASHVAGLTFPVSNLLLPISNYLVSKNERSKLTLSALERTKLSGRRHVLFKTHFPNLLHIVLNTCVMLPFHWLQKLCSASSRALVIYFELKPSTSSGLSNAT